ncbi:MAG TPA: NADH-quinone oxidoreductase subunit NuoG [Vicinamibacterales bacterium]|nr:NADH-quinone oxidoreductase subunit NuoG [Vicinamibacterales bacterium]
MARIFIDGRPCDVRDGINLLDACLSLGYDLPYFCWHPAMGSVGACRQCAVKQFRDEHDTRGRLVMACMTAAADTTRLSIDDPEAREFRTSVGEWLMVHHPHDCPVCDEGGECHLQDMTVMDNHTYRRYRGTKRTFRNQDLGPFVNQEMNRCIQCYRCVRFYRDYAGGRDFDVQFLRDRVFFGRHRDGVLESPFSGNLVEVCPTGVFTDKTLKRHFTRKWDERTAPSVCVHCAVGCNTVPGERYLRLRRIRARFNHDVNGYFLCDRGRYGYEFVNDVRRLRAPRVGRGPDQRDATAADAVERAAPSLAAGRAIGIGSPRASIEANFALRSLVGAGRFFSGASEADHQLAALILQILRTGPVPTASLHDVEQADAVFVLGEDVANTAPMLALALRQSVRRQPMAIADRLHIPEWDDAAVREAVQDAKGPLFIATPIATHLDDAATAAVRGAPDDLARLGFAVARAIEASAPVSGSAGPGEARDHAGTIAGTLREAARPLIVSGTGCGSRAMIEAAANVAWALHRAGRPARLALIAPECNSLGVALADAGGLDAAFDAIDRGTADTIVVLENDLYRRAAPAAVRRVLDRAAHVIAIDHLATATTAAADVVLPAGTFAESDGTLVSYEGRAQRFFQVFPPDGEVRESWRWIRDLLAAAGRTDAAAWQTLDDITAALASALPAFAAVAGVAPPATFRIAGLKVAREPHRYSGRTAKYAGVTVHEPKPPDDPDSALSFTMEGYTGQPPSALIPRFWSPGWNSVQSVNTYQTEVGGPLRGGDPGVRLVEPPAGSSPAYFKDVPPPFERRAGQWLCVPLHHIFGSEELSALAPGVASLAPQPYVALNPDDLASAGVEAGSEATVTIGDDTFRLAVRAAPSVPAGIAGIAAGLPSHPWLPLPALGRIRRGEGAR